MSTWIKICGNTKVQDARLAVSAGANALGFIFAPSPRRMTAEQVRQITGAVHSAERIGIFVNESPKKVAEVFEAAKLTGVQIHGDESPDQVREIRERLEEFSSQNQAERAGLRIIKTLYLTTNFPQKLEEFSGSKLVDAILIDNFAAHQRGGTGRSFDWQAARELLPGNSKLRFIIAGGLRPENVQDALAILEPWGVDVASGLEREVGMKDPEKVRAFCTAVRNFRPLETVQSAKEKI